MAILLNLLFNHWRAGTIEEQSTIAVGVNRRVNAKDIFCLEHGDHCLEGTLYDADGDVVPVVAVSGEH